MLYVRSGTGSSSFSTLQVMKAHKSPQKSLVSCLNWIPNFYSSHLSSVIFGLALSNTVGFIKHMTK